MRGSPGHLEIARRRSSWALAPGQTGLGRCDGIAIGSAGFSLIEALVVLIVAGMALMLVLSLGAKTARTGFDLGRRALASADSAVAQDEFRAIVHGLELAPAGADARSLGLRPLTGDAQALTANVVLDRSGHCGPAGPAGVLRLSVASGAGGDVLICQTQFGAPATVLDARPRRIRLEYSPDGTTWAESWSAPQSSAGLSKPLAEQVVFVRLVSADGKIDLVERASSGPAFFYPSLIAPNLIGPSLVAPVHP